MEKYNKQDNMSAYQYLTPDKIQEYATAVTMKEPDLAAEIAHATRSELQYSEMLTGEIEGRLLNMLASVSGARRILEVGLFTGYSAYMMASALPDNGTLISLEMNERYRDIAERYLSRSEHWSKIEIKMGNALQTIPQIEGSFDMMFLDADKEHYPDYYDLLVPRLNTGGLLVVDNALWYGEVLQPDDRKALAIDRLNRTIRDDGRVENVLLTVRDGIHLVRKITQ